MDALLHLAYHADNTIRLALLKALEQIGDARAIPAVLYLRDDPTILGRVRLAANECLPYLEARQRRSRESATLLRAADRVETVASREELLRPASHSLPTTPEDQLLHSSTRI